jgi:4-amino-4-deoxy-L-arabinose transferase-like glycosyltransferase
MSLQPQALDYAPPRSRGAFVLSPRTAATIVLALAALGFALRATAIFALHRWEQPNAIEHRALALSLVEHGTFYFRDFGKYGPSSVQSPSYPFLLAMLFRTFGPDSTASYIAAMLINSLAGALTVWLTWKMVRALGGSSAAALLAAALIAIWPSQVYAATHVQAISLITLCIVAMIYLFQRSVQTGSLASWIGYSIIGTLAALTEPVLLPIVALSGLLIVVWRVWRVWRGSSLSIEQRIRNAAVLLAAALLIIMPWTVRNRTVHERWIPIKSTFWVNVWKANNDFATGTDRLELSEEKQAALRSGAMSLSDRQLVDPRFDNQRQYDRLTPEQRARLENQPEAVREEVFREFATSWIASHPARYLQLCLIRLGKTLWVDWDNPKSHNVLFWLSRAILLGLGIPGLVIAIRQRWALLFAALIAGSCLLTYALTITAARFSLPLEPLALCMVAAFLAGGWRSASANK